MNRLSELKEKRHELNIAEMATRKVILGIINKAHGEEGPVTDQQVKESNRIINLNYNDRGIHGGVEIKLYSFTVVFDPSNEHMNNNKVYMSTQEISFEEIDNDMRALKDINDFLRG